MFYLYLDESGDLGFDFQTKRPSEFFTVAIVAVKGYENNCALINAVKKTRRRKLYKKHGSELKGSSTSFEIKRYFYNMVSSIPFDIYALTLNKKQVHKELGQNKDGVYNFIARGAVDHVNFKKALDKIVFIIDRSKSRKEICKFDNFIINQLKGRINPRVPLNIYHYTSHKNMGLQAADMFSWGIYRKYEKKDYEWYELFKERIKYEDLYS